MKAYNKKTGKPVKPGDIILSFRNEEWIYKYPSRANEYNRDGKVTVCKDPSDSEREFYANVFDLEVRDE